MMMSPTTQRTISQNTNSLLPSSQTKNINSPRGSKLISKTNNVFKNKYDFIIKYLPFINCNKIILTGVKNMFEADIQIDDKIGHLKNNVKTKFMFTSYHNRNITDAELKENNVVRVNNWNDIAKHLL